MALFKTVAYLEVQNLFQIWFQLEYTAEFPPSQELLYFSVREILLGRGLIWTNELYSFVSFSVSFFYLLFCLLCSPPPSFTGRCPTRAGTINGTSCHHHASFLLAEERVEHLSCQPSTSEHWCLCFTPHFSLRRSVLHRRWACGFLGSSGHRCSQW